MRTFSLGLTLFVTLVALVFGASAQADDGDLAKALEAFFAEEDDAARAGRGMALATKHTDPKIVAAAVSKARRWAPDGPADKVATWTRTSPGGLKHTVFASIPPQYDASKAWPVLIWLHGAVAREQDGGGASGIRTMGEIADEEGFLLLSPSTRKGAEWWSPNGVALIRGALQDLARNYRVDADRVAVSGFSDGASGCFHLLAHDPEPYCCFMPLMGHPGVTRLAGGPTFPVNVRSRPVFAFSGGVDTLYPSARMKPLIQEVKRAGARLTWTDLEEAGHRVTDVLPLHWDKLRDFWNANPRDPLQKEIEWQTAVPGREGRFGWVEILAVDPKAPAAKDGRHAPLPDPAGRPRLGVRIDRTYPGPGIKLESVQEKTAAADAGFLAADVITHIDGTKLGGAQEAMMVLVRALGTMTDRDGVFVVSRGAETLTLKARPRAAGAGGVARPKELGYGMPSGRIGVVRRDGNTFVVTAHQVRRFKLHLADGMVDLDKPITVIVNGKPAKVGAPEGDTGYVLQQAARQVGGPIYRAAVTVDVR